LVVDTSRGTTLGKNGVTISTVEHLLAALIGCKIDNVLVEVDGPEIPILDGSSQPFVDAILSVGLKEQNAERVYFEIKENITYEDTERQIEMLAVPQDDFRVTVMVDYNSPLLGTQHATMYKINEFNTEIAKCRTFVFVRELEMLIKNNLIKGGDLNNAIVICDTDVPQSKLDELAALLNKPSVKVEGRGILNNTQLYFFNEPARHKLLDIVGDLALVGMPIKGHILAARPGHYGNVAFAKKIKSIINQEKQKKRKGVYEPYDLNKPAIIDIHEIQKLLPHRQPFLLIDKITEMTDTSIVGIKNVTMNEDFFRGHFPDAPVMPGVLQIEAMAQVGGVFALKRVPDPENYLTFFMSIDKVKFKNKVIPGDTIVFKLELLTPIRRGIVHMRGEAFVREKLVMEAEMMAQLAKVKSSEPTILTNN
jgi:UDP-3-O-[3-hydroxymyristoyl] N-acetylglucosamine deacetylase/3-hydroxyacyl-[acyl-carrier-protein] dehydratase